MKDLAFKSGNLYLENNDLNIIEKSEAIKEELYVFLNIRACHKNENGEIIIPGELEYDQNQGIDFTFVFDIDTSDEQVKNHYKNKILAYYGQYITEISNIKIDRNKNKRKIELNFKYKTIWSNKKQKFKMESEV